MQSTVGIDTRITEWLIIPRPNLLPLLSLNVLLLSKWESTGKRIDTRTRLLFVPHWISYLTEYFGVKWIILRSRFYIDILYFKHSIFIYFTKFFNLYLCSMDDNFFLIFKSIRNLYTIFENMFYIICMDTFISSNNSSYLLFSLNFFTSSLLYHFFYIFFLCCRTDWRWKICMYKYAWFIKSNFYLLW